MRTRGPGSVRERLAGQHVAHHEGEQRHASARAPIQNRRVMSTSSGFGVLDRADRPRLERHAADRAVPGRVAHDLGMHRAGPLASRGAGAGITGSSAMPHFGHVPGPRCRTSGCIGQVYIRSSAVMPSPSPGLRAHAACPAASGAGTNGYTVEPAIGPRSARTPSGATRRRSRASGALMTSTADRRPRASRRTR